MKLDELEAKAKAAGSTGPWLAPDARWIPNPATSAFIAAANPATVLKLIALLREYHAILDHCHGEMMDHQGRCRKMDALADIAMNTLTKLGTDL